MSKAAFGDVAAAAPCDVQPLIRKFYALHGEWARSDSRSAQQSIVIKMVALDQEIDEKWDKWAGRARKFEWRDMPYGAPLNREARLEELERRVAALEREVAKLPDVAAAKLSRELSAAVQSIRTDRG